MSTTSRNRLVPRALAGNPPASPAQPKLTPWQDYFVAVVGFLVIYGFILTFVARAYVVPSGSMEPTFHGCAGCTNDRIIAEKVSYYFSAPQPGDVVVFAGPPAWNVGYTAKRSSHLLVRGVQNLLAFYGLENSTENILTKRVIATAGQTVSCQAGDPGVMVDGQSVPSDFVLSPPEHAVSPVGGSAACGGPYFGPVTVPAGAVWVMGDNRTGSADSRAHVGDELQGTVPLGNIRGKVRFIFFPLNRAGAVATAKFGAAGKAHAKS